MIEFPKTKYSMNRLAGKRVLITGASAGIGEACANTFAESGADLLLSARRIERVEELATRLSEDHGVEVHTARLDVTDSSAVTAYVEEIADANLVPDILINNAGKAVWLDLLHEGSIDAWEDMIDTNIKGLLYVSRAVIPLTDPHLPACFAHPPQPPEHRCGIDGPRSQYRQLGLQRCPWARIKDNLRFFPCFNQLADVQVKQRSTAGNRDAPVRYQA